MKIIQRRYEGQESGSALFMWEKGKQLVRLFFNVGKYQLNMNFHRFFKPHFDMIFRKRSN